MTDDEFRPALGQAISGRVTEFVRVGDAVHRPATANTESIYQLLLHLERFGFDGAPRVVGSELGDTIVLTWIDGWVPTDLEGWKLDRRALQSVGQLLRAYHDCAQGFTTEAGFEDGPQEITEGGHRRVSPQRGAQGGRWDSGIRADTRRRRAGRPGQPAPSSRELPFAHC